MAFGNLPIAVAPQQLRLNLGGEQGEPFLFCDNLALPFPDDAVDEVITNYVPVNQVTWLGPGVQRSEIERVLRPGGTWRDNGIIVYTKP